jgi:hypothetical protein
MGFQAFCKLCGWESEESYLTKTEARVDGERHAEQNHEGSDCTGSKKNPIA